VITTPKGETFEKHLKCDQFFTRAAALALVLIIEFGFGHGTYLSRGRLCGPVSYAKPACQMEVFHHRATLCIAAYGFLICEREAIQGCPRRQVRANRRRDRMRGDPKQCGHLVAQILGSTA
jgi:hypothetical protein